jgi:hypothetical protein
MLRGRLLLLLLLLLLWHLCCSITHVARQLKVGHIFHPQWLLVLLR